MGNPWSATEWNKKKQPTQTNVCYIYNKNSVTVNLWVITIPPPPFLAERDSHKEAKGVLEAEKLAQAPN